MRARVWECRTHALEDGSKQKKMVDMAQSSVSLLGLIEPALNYEKGELVKQVKQQGFGAVKELSSRLALSWSKVAKGTYGTGAQQAASYLTNGALAAGTQLSTKGKKGSLTLEPPSYRENVRRQKGLIVF